MNNHRRNPQPAGPWASTAAVLAGCLVTIVCALRGIDPDVIVLRMACAAACTGLVVAVMQAGLNAISK